MRRKSSISKQTQSETISIFKSQKTNQKETPLLSQEFVIRPIAQQIAPSIPAEDLGFEMLREHKIMECIIALTGMQMEDTTTLNLLKTNSHLVSYIP